MRCLVTGGAGFIGSHLVDALVKQGGSVRVLDNFVHGWSENLQSSMASIELITGDVRDGGTVAAACRDIDVVFHLAALGSVARSIEDPITTLEVNVMGTQNVLLAARDAGVRRVIFASSSSVYSNTGPARKNESMVPEPRTPYAVHKLTGEELCRVATSLWDVETVSLRLFAVYGPRQEATSRYAAYVPTILRQIAAGQPPSIDGDGHQTRDFTYVADAVSAAILAARAPSPARIINVGRGESTSVLGVLRQAQSMCGSATPPRFGPARVGDIRHIVADISVARDTLGFAPSVTLAEGLSRTSAAMAAAA